jgi:hypothetical protein
LSKKSGSLGIGVVHRQFWRNYPGDSQRTKKVIAPGERRELARYVMQTYEMSERRTYRLLSVSRTVYRDEAKSSNDQEIIQELLRVAEWQPWLGL